jgi:hypothetical protein
MTLGLWELFVTKTSFHQQKKQENALFAAIAGYDDLKLKINRKLKANKAITCF